MKKKETGISKKEKELLDNYPKFEVKMCSKKECKAFLNERDKLLKKIKTYQTEIKDQQLLIETLSYALRSSQGGWNSCIGFIHNLGYEAVWKKREEEGKE